VKFSELDGKRVVLWGLGRETSAFRSQLEQHLPTARISAVIDDATPVTDARDSLEHADVLVRSPGVSIYKPLIQAVLAEKMPVTTPTALWMAERGGRHVIGVTGTKGKSTTATVIAHLLDQLTPTELAGNIGRPVIDLLDLDPDTWVVLELSSYQIADLTTGPEVAVMTNLSREHTDWHGTEEQYQADKLRIFELPGTRAAVRPLGDRGGWHVYDDGAVHKAERVVLTPEQIPLRGRHNAANVATALAAIEAAGFELPPLSESLRAVTGLPHRLETVHLAVGPVEWVDDSISTTPESTIAALETFGSRHVVLLAGGSERDQDYEELGAVLAQRPAITLVTLPDTGPRLAQTAAAHGLSENWIVHAADMREATRLAGTLTRHGSVVLLSPAAPSFNAYKNFEERGDDFAAFARAVAFRA
jgi:UDP-N-acetylmuramoyl-L-alanine---L-glutamate ligase